MSPAAMLASDFGQTSSSDMILLQANIATAIVLQDLLPASDLFNDGTNFGLMHPFAELIPWSVGRGHSQRRGCGLSRVLTRLLELGALD